MLGLGISLSSAAVSKQNSTIFTVLNLGPLGLEVGGNLDNDRATPATFTDFEGITRTARAGETRIQGGWRVENLVPEFSDSGWVIGVSGTGVPAVKTLNYSQAPDGTNTATLLQLNKGTGTTANDSSYLSYTVPALSNSVGSLWMKSNQAGSVVVTIGTTNAHTSVVVTTAWQRFAYPTDPTATTEFTIELRGAQTPINPQTASVLIWHPMLEDKQYAQNSAPSPYISSTIEYDATVPGVKYFDVINANTVSNGVVTEAVGIPITPRPYVLLAPEDDIKVVMSDTVNWSQECGAFMMKYEPTYDASASSMQTLISLGGTTPALLLDSAVGYVMKDGTNTVTSTTSGVTANTVHIVAMVWNADQGEMAVSYSTDGGVTFQSWHQSAYDAAFDAGTYIEWFKGSTLTNKIYRSKAYLTTRKTTSQLRQWVERNASLEMA